MLGRTRKDVDVYVERHRSVKKKRNVFTPETLLKSAFLLRQDPSEIRKTVLECCGRCTPTGGFEPKRTGKDVDLSPVRGYSSVRCTAKDEEFTVVACFKRPTCVASSVRIQRPKRP